MFGKDKGSLVAQLQKEVVDSGVPISLVRHIDGPLMIVWDRLPAHRSRMVREFRHPAEGKDSR